MIRTHALTKRFAMAGVPGLGRRTGTVTAVDGIDLDVREGDVYGFLGANGSGKTTTVRMLLGLVLATSGEAEVLGQSMPASAAAVLPDVGALVEGPGAYPYLSGRANLATIDAVGPGASRAGRRSRIDDTLDQVGLDPSDRRPVRTYSLGMRQRLGLAAALLRRPRLLVLDEPTNGLDPQGTHEIRELLLALNAAGTTIFMSSHLMAEVEQMCTRIGVLDRGRLVLQDELATLLAPTGRVVVHTRQTEWTAELLGPRAERVGNGHVVVITDDASAVNAELVAAGIPVTQIGPLRHDLEDVVLRATEDR